jgi:hypothetical protein
MVSASPPDLRRRLSLGVRVPFPSALGLVCRETRKRCHRLVRWSFTLVAKKRAPTFLRCHRLARWSFTFSAIRRSACQLAANVNLHGASPWHPKSGLFSVATNVRLHRTSRWHLSAFLRLRVPNTSHRKSIRETDRSSSATLRDLKLVRDCERYLFGPSSVRSESLTVCTSEETRQYE